VSRQHHRRKAMQVRMGDIVRLRVNVHRNSTDAFQPVASFYLRTMCLILNRVGV